jgi:uncharacterized DUF497 family protein
VEFEFDEEEAAANLRKHGVSFAEAATVFDDPMSLTYLDTDHSLDEVRYLTIGTSLCGRLLIVSHTDREERVRLISARNVTSTEWKSYEG